VDLPGCGKPGRAKRFFALASHDTASELLRVLTSPLSSVLLKLALFDHILQPKTFRATRGHLENLAACGCPKQRPGLDAERARGRRF